MLKYLWSQFENPRGPLGYLVGLILEYKNRKRNAWAVSLLDIQPNDHVLEIGFGPGDALRRVCAINNKGFTAGIDHSAVMIKLAQNRNADAVKENRLELREGSAMALPYADSSFDKTFTINSLHIWPDAVKGLQEMRRVLKPGGLLTIIEQPRSAISTVQMNRFIAERTNQLEQVELHNIRVETNPMKPASTVAWLGSK